MRCMSTVTRTGCSQRSNLSGKRMLPCWIAAAAKFVRPWLNTIIAGTPRTSTAVQ
jgi:hypothetical protein